MYIWNMLWLIKFRLIKLGLCNGVFVLMRRGISEISFYYMLNKFFVCSFVFVLFIKMGKKLSSSKEIYLLKPSL